MHTRISGVADHFAKNDDEALDKIRGIINHLPESKHIIPVSYTHLTLPTICSV